MVSSSPARPSPDLSNQRHPVYPRWRLKRRRRKRPKRQAHYKQSLGRSRMPNHRPCPAHPRPLVQPPHHVRKVAPNRRLLWWRSRLSTRMTLAIGLKRGLIKLWRQSAMIRVQQVSSQAGSWFEKMVAFEDLRLIRTGEWAISKARKTNAL